MRSYKQDNFKPDILAIQECKYRNEPIEEMAEEMNIEMNTKRQQTNRSLGKDYDGMTSALLGHKDDRGHNNESAAFIWDRNKFDTPGKKSNSYLIYLPTYLPTYLPLYLSLSLSISLSSSLSLSISLSLYLSMHKYMHTYIYLFFYPL